MESPGYDKTSVQSIYEFSKLLSGKSLAEVADIPIEIINSNNKGDLGSLLELFYFQHRPPNNSGPDFPEAGVELKTTGVVLDSKNRYRAKERLVLTMINFDEIVHETWETSTFLSKCRLILILFYLYERDRPVVDRRFVINPILFRIEEWELPTIRRDWEFIRDKVIAGQAHQLSEGDTIYLGAARKGSGGSAERLRTQPNSPIAAKARAFAFKSTYVDALINGASHGHDLAGEQRPFEEAVLSRFSSYIGSNVGHLSSTFGLRKFSTNQKGFHRQLAVKLLTENGDSMPALEKAGIELKTIRLSRNGMPRESMSFPGFKFLEILSEEWEDSTFFEKLEKKFLFVVFRETAGGEEILENALLWNMPYGDRLEAERVWRETKRRVAIDATDLPGMSESPVAHIRPKGRNGNDKIPTPQGGMHLRQAFWLNRAYIATVLNSR